MPYLWFNSKTGTGAWPGCLHTGWQDASLPSESYSPFTLQLFGAVIPSSHGSIKGVLAVLNSTRGDTARATRQFANIVYEKVH